MDTEKNYTFGPHKISIKDVFYTTHLSFAFVNLRPVLPGHILYLWRLNDIFGTDNLKINFLNLNINVHVLVSPKREVKRFVDLTADETNDLWITAHKIAVLKYHNLILYMIFVCTIKDGPQAGQSVPHVHIHILPRKVGDFERNDEIYDSDDNTKLKQKMDLDMERKDRSPEERALEAEEYRKLFL
ncbi:Histidine triad (HIT) protein [Parasponia andersonii]|uniref:Histidine triad (HIT) protein n=1 Tax=Parasponia andersonii TaxID=3476 RepID=A0A2P5D8F7_PARAD|nr:Histidine triad (HIT) protein [Parasponia andersonii]